MNLNLFNNRITNKIVMPDGIFTLCIVNCTHNDLYMMNVRGSEIEKLKPIEDVIDGEKINLSWPDRLAYGILISKYFLSGLPQRCDGTIKVFAIHQTIVSSSMERDKVVKDFELVASYDVNKQVWKDANYIPIVEMNTVVSQSYEFLEQILLQFESPGEGVMSMIEGKLTQYDGLVTNLINCSEHEYFTIVENQIIPVPGLNSYDWFTHGSESEFGLNDEYREEAEAKWKDCVMREFGLTKHQIKDEHDIFVSVTASHDYPRRKITLRNLPKDKTYQKVVYQVKRVLEKNVEEYLRPFFISGCNLPIFRSKQAAELFIKVFKGKVSLYHSAQGSITIKRLADYKIDMMRGKYVRKETSVVKTAKRFILSSFMDKAFELVCDGVMRFMDFLLGRGSKAAKKASEFAKSGKAFYKMSSGMFAAAAYGPGTYASHFYPNDDGTRNIPVYPRGYIIGEGKYGFDYEGKSERAKPRKETPINKKAKSNDDFGHFVAKTPGSYREKEVEKTFNFDRELKQVEHEEAMEQSIDEYQLDIDADRYYDLNGVPIRGLDVLMDYSSARSASNEDVGVLKYHDVRRNCEIHYLPYREDLLTQDEDGCTTIDYEKLEDYKTKLSNNKSTIYIIDFDKVMQYNDEMEQRSIYIKSYYRQLENVRAEVDKIVLDELIRANQGQFVDLRNKRDRLIMKGCPEYLELRRIMKSDARRGLIGAEEKDYGVSPALNFVVPEDHPYFSRKDYVAATPSYKEIVEERIKLDNDADERWQNDRLELEESYEEDVLSQKRTGKKGFFRRVFDKVKSIWCSTPVRVIRKIVGFGLAGVGIWRAINTWKNLAEGIISAFSFLTMQKTFK